MKALKTKINKMSKRMQNPNTAKFISGCLTRLNNNLYCQIHPLVIAGVLNVTLRFPRTKVPAKETTYLCFSFQLPDDREYHLIATEPLIDNQNVMHHMILNACGSTGQYHLIAAHAVLRVKELAVHTTVSAFTN